MLAVVAAVFVFLPDKIKDEHSSISVTANTLLSATATATATNFQPNTNELKATVLMYHYIGDLPQNADNIRKGLTVSGEEFEGQLKYFTQKGYTITTLSGFDTFRQRQQIPEKLAILTFDDGYLDNYEVAFPIMKKYNATGTFFIITKKIGTTGYMTEEQIKELSSSGNEIGSHSVNHLSLDKYKGNSLKSEIVDSKETLEKLISKTVISFCYPAGKYNADTTKAVEEAGYKYAVTTQSSNGTLDLGKSFEITRYRMSSGRNLEAMLK